MRVRLGTRTSRLARWQTTFVADWLRAARPELECQVVEISTQGDEIQDRPLPEIGGKGLFTERIEQALRAGTIDAAVHSLKDLPVDESPGLTIAAVLGREEARDALVSRDGCLLSALPAGAVVGTSSTRREAQLRALRPDLTVKAIRGNVETRIAKVERGEYDATVMAGAGLARLGLAGRATEWISVEEFLPAPGQGALAVQCRADDRAVIDVLALIDDKALRRETNAEREFLRCLGGGCAAPVAAFARADGIGSVTLIGRVLSRDGQRVVGVKGEGDDPLELARRLAHQALGAGAGAILARERQPLKGRRVLVTRPREQAWDLCALLSERGAVPVLVPLIRIEPAGESSAVTAALSALRPEDWIIFTSTNAVEHFFGHLADRVLPQRTAAVGPATAEALGAKGIVPAFVPAEHTGAALARGLVALEGGSTAARRFLLPCAVDHSEDATRVLRGAGATVQELPVYRTVAEEPDPEEMAVLSDGIDAVLFLSGSAVRAFRAPEGVLARAVVGCIGPSTAEAAKDAGITVDVMPREHTARARVEALEERFR